MPRIARESLMTLEAYAKARNDFRARVIAHKKTREVLEWIPDTTINTVERCAGHDGTWGVKSEFFDMSMKIGKPVFRQMGDDNPDYLSSDCPIAGRRIAQGIGALGGSGIAPRKEHPLTLMCIAYGLEG